MRLLKLLLFALLCIAVGWHPPPPEVNPADADARAELQRGIDIVRAHKLNPTFRDWENCADSLTFLLEQGDPDAQEFGIRVLPRIAEVDIVLDRAIMNLAYDSYTDWQSLQTILRTMPLKDQVYIVLLLDDLDPVDWLPGRGDQVLLLNANPGLMRAYLAQKALGNWHGLDPRNNQ